MEEYWKFYVLGDEVERLYSYNPETGVITNLANGRTVKVDKHIDFEVWLLKIRAYQIRRVKEKPLYSPERYWGGEVAVR